MMVQASELDVNAGQAYSRDLLMKPLCHNGRVYDVVARVGREDVGDVLELAATPRPSSQYGAAVAEYDRELADAVCDTDPNCARTMAETFSALERTRRMNAENCDRVCTNGGWALLGTSLVVLMGTAPGVGVGLAGFFYAYGGLLGALGGAAFTGGGIVGAKARAKGVVSKQTLRELPAAAGNSSLALKILETGLRNLEVVDSNPRRYTDKTIRTLPTAGELQDEFVQMRDDLRGEADDERAEARELNQSSTTRARIQPLLGAAADPSECADVANAIAGDAQRIQERLHAFQLDLERHVVKAKLKDAYRGRQPPRHFEFAAREPILEQVSD